MGVEFAYEFVQIAYKVSDFRAQTPHQAELKGFLAKDMCGTDCDPNEHVGSLHITVLIDRLSPLIGMEFAWSSPIFRRPQKQQYVNTIKALDRLKPIPVKRESHLRLYATPTVEAIQIAMGTSRNFPKN
jgi:hypothetical protein